VNDKQLATAVEIVGKCKYCPDPILKFQVVAHEGCMRMASEAEIKRLKEDHQIELQMLGEDLIDKCQSRVERIFKELEAHKSLIDYDCLMVECYWYQELKKQEGVK